MEPQHSPHPHPTTRLDEVRRAHNVVAVFPSLDKARDAVHHLEQAGFSEEISLLGAETAEHPAEESERSQSEVGLTVAEAASAGAVGGGVLGALASFAIPGIGPVVAAGIWAVAGATAGGFMGGVSSLGDSEAWRETFQAVEDGNVVVGVHSDDEDQIDDGEAALNDLEPIAINRFAS